MAQQPLETLLASPTPVAVHDDGDMRWQSRKVDPQRDGFLLDLFQLGGGVRQGRRGKDTEPVPYRA
jgi:hypothetical protein